MNATITTATAIATLSGISESVTEKTTFNELLSSLGPVTAAVRKPTPKVLREGDAPIAQSADGSLIVYPSGYATYSDGDAMTVVFVPDCGSYLYYFDHHDSAEIKDSIVLDEDILGSQPWEIALTLRGASQIENNRFNRTGNRKGTGGKEEESDDQRKADHLCVAHFPDPLTYVIRKEFIEEELAKMTPKQKEIYLLFYREGYSKTEIASMTNISVMGVIHHLQDAETKVNHMLKSIISD